jgi:hypothetical protein
VVGEVGVKERQFSRGKIVAKYTEPFGGIVPTFSV